MHEIVEIRRRTAAGPGRRRRRAAALKLRSQAHNLVEAARRGYRVSRARVVTGSSVEGAGERHAAAPGHIRSSDGRWAGPAGEPPGSRARGAEPGRRRRPRREPLGADGRRARRGAAPRWRAGRIRFALAFGPPRGVRSALAPLRALVPFIPVGVRSHAAVFVQPGRGRGPATGSALFCSVALALGLLIHYTGTISSNTTLRPHHAQP
jgi:hypothetical protein